MSRSAPRHVAVVTGTRAEFGLLRPVLRAIDQHGSLRLSVIAAGAHLLPPSRTVREVEMEYTVAARVPMQRAGRTGRQADAEALGRGVSGFARAFGELKPNWVVVLGDRIEAFAAASAASIAGMAVCHIHGGDRAEGIADEAMRHAITKLSHLHCAASRLSAKRVITLGEPEAHVHIVGSPAIDGLRAIRAMNDHEARSLGDPRAVVLLHPAGLSPREEAAWALKALTRACDATAGDARMTKKAGLPLEGILILSPNMDAGRESIAEVWAFASGLGARVVDHLPRAQFVGLLKRLATQRGVLVGNSSAGLIECAALRVPVVNLGSRQAGRERGGNVLDIPVLSTTRSAQEARSVRARCAARPPASHPFGDGHSGQRIARLLARTDPHAPELLRKRNTY